jgi:tRNA modification GTPase
LTERADIGGLSLSLIDTAGMRETADVVEQEGVARARNTIGVADLVLVVLDRSRQATQEDRDLLETTASRSRLLVLNKSDLPAALACPRPALEVSAKTGAGIDRLIEAIAAALTANEPLRDQPHITNTRHIVLLERARAAIDRATTAIDGQISEEFPLLDLQEAAHALQEITGQRTSDDLLRHIFERFCIGK